MHNASTHRDKLACLVGRELDANLTAPASALCMTVAPTPFALECADAFAAYGVEIVCTPRPVFSRLLSIIDGAVMKRTLVHFYADNYPAWTELTDEEVDEIEARRVERLRELNEQFVAEAA